MDKDELLKKTVAIARKYLPKDFRLILFGSWAKDSAEETSDLDIGILGKKTVSYEIIKSIKREVETLPTLRKVDIIDLNDVDKKFKDNVLKYGRKLWPMN